MRGVTIKDTSYSTFKDKLLLLDLANAGEHLVTELIQRSTSFVQSPGGKVLPLEIWLIITNFLAALPPTKPSYCLVKAQVISSARSKRLLRCTKQEFDPDSGTQLRNIKSKRQVDAFEAFFSNATPATVEKIRQREEDKMKSGQSTPGVLGRNPARVTTQIPALRELAGANNTFYVFLDGSRAKASGILSRDITVPEAIAHIGQGECGLCEGKRSICPGCAPGAAMGGFDVWLGCGAKLTCPLCMGLELSRAHEYYLTTWKTHCIPRYMRANSSGDRETMRDSVVKVLMKLGYEWDGECNVDSIV